MATTTTVASCLVPPTATTTAGGGVGRGLADGGCKARYAVLFQIYMFPSRSGDEAHIGPTVTYDEVICPGFPTLYHNITNTRIQHLIQLAFNFLKYNTSTEGICLST